MLENKLHRKLKRLHFRAQNTLERIQSLKKEEFQYTKKGSLENKIQNLIKKQKRNKEN